MSEDKYVSSITIGGETRKIHDDGMWKKIEQVLSKDVDKIPSSHAVVQGVVTSAAKEWSNSGAVYTSVTGNVFNICAPPSVAHVTSGVLYLDMGGA